MARDDEFERIIKFFNMTPEERTSNFEQIFADSADFFAKFNHIMKEGSIEEKQHMIKELQELQRVVKEETSKLSETSGMSEDELRAFAENQDNFEPEQWEMIQNARSRIQKDASEVHEMLHFNFAEEEGGEEKPKTPKKKKRPDWDKA